MNFKPHRMNFEAQPSRHAARQPLSAPQFFFRPDFFGAAEANGPPRDIPAPKTYRLTPETPHELTSDFSFSLLTFIISVTLAPKSSLWGGEVSGRPWSVQERGP